jgi:hypothetical protein
MHGLILRTVQIFTEDTYGRAEWAAVAARAGIETPGFEAMLHYDPAMFACVLDAAEAQLGKPRDAILEDMGTYLVSHPNRERLRRLLRFGGVDFIEFLYSLDDLPERARLAVADLDLPDLELQDGPQNTFQLRVTTPHAGAGHVVVGMLRAMADDYGALVLLDHLGRAGDTETISVVLIQSAYTQGRSFALSAIATAEEIGP